MIVIGAVVMLVAVGLPDLALFGMPGGMHGHQSPYGRPGGSSVDSGGLSGVAQIKAAARAAVMRAQHGA